MKTFSNTNAKTDYFRDKAHYLAFRAAWATAFQTKTLDARYMLLYAWLRGKDIRSAFTPVQSLNKLKNGHSFDRAISNAYWTLKRVAEAVPGGHAAEEQAKFLAVFNGTLDAETLTKAFQDMPKHFGNITSTAYGIGEKIATKIADWKALPVQERIKAHIDAIEKGYSSCLWYIIETELEKDRKEAEERMLARKAEAEKPRVATSYSTGKLIKPTLAQRVKGLFS